jgi:hypothetical protein
VLKNHMWQGGLWHVPAALGASPHGSACQLLAQVIHKQALGGGDICHAGKGDLGG